MLSCLDETDQKAPREKPQSFFRSKPIKKRHGRRGGPGTASVRPHGGREGRCARQIGGDAPTGPGFAPALEMLPATGRELPTPSDRRARAPASAKAGGGTIPACHPELTGVSGFPRSIGGGPKGAYDPPPPSLPAARRGFPRGYSPRPVAKHGSGLFCAQIQGIVSQEPKVGTIHARY